MKKIRPKEIILKNGETLILREANEEDAKI